MFESAKSLGRFSNSAESYKAQMITAGFENVVELQYKWPQNRWPVDRKLKEIGMLPSMKSHRQAEFLTRMEGMWTLENFTTGLSGLSMALFTRGLGWTAKELEVFLVDVRKDMRDTKIHTYYPM
jgi:hypothetical protein